MGLLRGPDYKEHLQYRLDHLSVDFINDIEIPELPSLEIQNVATKFLRRLYEVDIDFIDSRIEGEFEESAIFIQRRTQNYNECSDLIRVKNKELFYKNIKKGKFQDPIEDYIEILKPDLIDEEYLLYYLYYTGVLDKMSNHYVRKHQDFNNGNLEIRLVSLLEQQFIIVSLRDYHTKIKKLIAKRRANKLELRKLMDEM